VRDAHCILDAGPLIAFIDRRDQHHSWAVSVLSTLHAAPMTCEPVLTEVCWQLRQFRNAVDRILQMPAKKELVVVPLLETDGEALATRMNKYWPRMDLADACVVRLSEKFPRAKVITTDVLDFSLYRRGNGNPIPVVQPSP
jgi:predicted nucleic acid-binding protein